MILPAALRRFAHRPHPVDPSAAMFGQVRRRLALWYVGVLAAALLIFGLLLYAAVQQSVFSDLHDRLRNQAGAVAQRWGLCQRFSPLQGGHGPQQGVNAELQSACFDSAGNLLNASASADPAFNTTTLAQRALTAGGAVEDRVGASSGETIERYAEPVWDPTGSMILGVVQVGEPVSQQLDTLRLLLMRLLAIGGVTLVGAGVGGLFLSNRALVPARLAFRRQQTFIADASHELRTPLTLLRADADLLLRARARLTADDSALVEEIVSEAVHMSALATNMLALARLDAGRYHPEREVVDLAALAAAVGRRAAALAAHEGVALIAEANETPVLVIGDQALLEQAILILVDNAIKYNLPGGSVTARAFVEGAVANLEISDTGIGIATEHLPHLGERFYRVDKARSRETGGAGLGISIARGIAGLHGGALTLRSTPGRGTRATLTLPAAQATKR